MSEPEKNPVIELGTAMWKELDVAFHYVMSENNLVEHRLCCQLWAGFMAAAFGAMMRDLGCSDAKLIVLDTLAPMADEIAAEQEAKRH